MAAFFSPSRSVQRGSPYWIGALILAAGAGILAWRTPKVEQNP